MAADSFGDIADRLDAAVSGPDVPAFEIVFGILERLLEEVLEDEADLVVASGFQMTAGEIEAL